jgi:hypothetical protein
MRKTLPLLISLLLAGCVKQSASYYVSDARDHAITVRAEQEYFWDQHITLTLVVARFPDCQRAIPMDKVAKPDVAVELFSTGDNVFTIRSGSQVLQVEAQDCTQLVSPTQDAMGQAVGVFWLGEKDKMTFEPAAPAANAAPAAPAAAPTQ